MPENHAKDVGPAFRNLVYLSSPPLVANINNNSYVDMPQRSAELEKQLSKKFYTRADANVTFVADQNCRLAKIGFQKVLDATVDGVRFDYVNLLSAHLSTLTDDQLNTLANYIRTHRANDIDTLYLASVASDMYTRGVNDFSEDSFLLMDQGSLEIAASSAIGIPDYFDTPTVVVPVSYITGQDGIRIDFADCVPYQDGSSGDEFYKLEAPEGLIVNTDNNSVNINDYICWVDVNEVDFSNLSDGLNYVVLRPFGFMQFDLEDATGQDTFYNVEIDAVSKKFEKILDNELPPSNNFIAYLNENIRQAIVENFSWEPFLSDQNEDFTNLYADDRPGWESDTLAVGSSDFELVRNTYGPVIDQLIVHRDLFLGNIFYNSLTQDTFQVVFQPENSTILLDWGKLDVSSALENISAQIGSSIVDQILYEADILPSFISSDRQTGDFDTFNNTFVQTYTDQILEISAGSHWGHLTIDRVLESRQPGSSFSSPNLSLFRGNPANIFVSPYRLQEGLSLSVVETNHPVGSDSTIAFSALEPFETAVMGKNLHRDLIAWLEENQIAVLSDKIFEDGLSKYPIMNVDPSILRSLDPTGYEAYITKKDIDDPLSDVGFVNTASFNSLNELGFETSDVRIEDVADGIVDPLVVSLPSDNDSLQNLLDSSFLSQIHTPNIQVVSAATGSLLDRIGFNEIVRAFSRVLDDSGGFDVNSINMCAAALSLLNSEQISSIQNFVVSNNYLVPPSTLINIAAGMYERSDSTVSVGVSVNTLADIAQRQLNVDNYDEFRDTLISGAERNLPVLFYGGKPTFVLPGDNPLLDRYTLNIGTYPDNQLRLDLVLIPPNDFEDTQNWEISRNISNQSHPVSNFDSPIIDDDQIKQWIIDTNLGVETNFNFLLSLDTAISVFSFNPNRLAEFDRSGYEKYLDTCNISDPLLIDNAAAQEIDEDLIDKRSVDVKSLGLPHNIDQILINANINTVGDIVDADMLNELHLVPGLIEEYYDIVLKNIEDKGLAPISYATFEDRLEHDPDISLGDYKPLDEVIDSVDISQLKRIPIRSVDLPEKLLSEAKIRTWQGDNQVEIPLVDYIDAECKSGFYGDYDGLEDIIEKLGVYYINRNDFADPNILDDPEIKDALKKQEAQFSAERKEYLKRLDNNDVSLKELLIDHNPDVDFVFENRTVIEKLSNGEGFYNCDLGEGIFYNPTENQLLNYKIDIGTAYNLDLLNNSLLHIFVSTNIAANNFDDFEVYPVDQSRDFISNKLVEISHSPAWKIDNFVIIKQAYLFVHTDELKKLFNTLNLPYRDVLTQVYNQSSARLPEIKFTVNDKSAQGDIADALLSCETSFVIDDNTFVVSGDTLDADEFAAYLVAAQDTPPRTTAYNESPKHVAAHIDEQGLPVHGTINNLENEVAQAKTAAHAQVQPTAQNRYPITSR